MSKTASADRLRTVLDRLPEGDESDLGTQSSKKLPKGVQEKELYQDILRIA
ncbi:MAG: hypothetical protein LUF27_02020 [Lachnospiraceae bacterium]|nr:hypothetical protein [Lachnospiraceae bacterium]